VQNDREETRQRQKRLLQELREGHQRFRSGNSRPRKYALYGSLAQVSKDVATVLCCSDSRIAPELVFDQSFGDLFVVRSAGHCLDEAILGSLEFAVTQVNSPLLLVMGHEDCRAVNAAMNKQTFDTPNLKEVIDLLANDLGEGPYRDLSHAVKAHVHNTAGAIAEKSPILGKKIVSGELMLAKMFISVSTGDLELLD
jgi:carbonic anhydrase